MSAIDRAVFEKVINNKQTCLLLISNLIKRGVEILNADGEKFDPRFLSDDEMMRLARQVIDELSARENIN